MEPNPTTRFCQHLRVDPLTVIDAELACLICFFVPSPQATSAPSDHPIVCLGRQARISSGLETVF
ncbi:hypothetical protein RhiLY_07445 [Ceratobasidium sp. AG-Ba]|nr:hypothetical protein RhiLY_07445 [Ceratobasidium sp. AG-Ba]